MNNDISVLHLSPETKWWIRRIQAFDLDHLVNSLRTTQFHVKGLTDPIYSKCFFELLEKASDYTREDFFAYWGLKRKGEQK